MDSEDTEAQGGFEQDERELIESINPDVMNVLAATGFFAALDDRLCPADSSVAAEKVPKHVRNNVIHCAVEGVSERGYSGRYFSDVISVMQAHGGYCDCEILYNVVETNRLKARHWQARARQHESDC